MSYWTEKNVYVLYDLPVTSTIDDIRKLLNDDLIPEYTPKILTDQQNIPFGCAYVALKNKPKKIPLRDMYEKRSLNFLTFSSASPYEVFSYTNVQISGSGESASEIRIHFADYISGSKIKSALLSSTPQIAYVTMATEEDAAEAIESLNGSVMDSTEIAVSKPVAPRIKAKVLEPASVVFEEESVKKPVKVESPKPATKKESER